MEKSDFPQIFAEVSCGDPDAVAFLLAFMEWVHLIDDFIDGDRPKPEAETVIKVNFEVMLAFAANPFWQANKKMLTPLLVSGTKAFSDSNRWATKPDFRDRATSDVLKSQYQEVLWYVALICGGYDHYDAMTRKYRSYFYDVRA